MTNEEFIKSISMEGEIWKDIIDFKDLYMVSNMGRVVSLHRENFNGVSYFHQNPKLLKPWTSTYGYKIVCLCSAGFQRKIAVHRLVAQAFIPNPKNYPNVDHIDTIRDNNVVENLRWVTQSINTMNPVTVKKLSDSHKGRPSLFRKPVVQMENGIILKTYHSIQAVREDGFNNVSVLRCCKNLQPDHAGYQWMYLDQYQLITKQP